MSRPIVILAFSNGPDSDLPYLNKESENLRDQFMRLQDLGLIDLRYYPNTSIEDLTKALIQLEKHVLIFHYGGHANPNQLELGSNSFFLDQISHLMVRYWKPTLVFLNGCSTSGMSHNLVENGIRAVISTEKPVDDKAAKDFAINFYSSLLSNKKIGESFELAKGIFKAVPKPNQHRRYPQPRSLNVELQLKEDFPWVFHERKRRAGRISHLRLSRFFRWHNWKGRVLSQMRFLELFASVCIVVSILIWQIFNKSHEILPSVNPDKERDTTSIITEVPPPVPVPPLKDEKIILITDQTGTPLKIEEGSGIFLVDNGSPLPNPIVQDPENNLYTKKTLPEKHLVHLAWQKNNISNPEACWTIKDHQQNEIDTFKIEVIRFLFEINVESLQEDGIDVPTSIFFTSSQSSDTLPVILDFNESSIDRVQIYLPYTLAPTPQTMVYPWVKPPLQVRTEICPIITQTPHRDVFCEIRFQYIQS